MLDRDGRTICQALGWSEDLVVIDSDDWRGEMHAPAAVEELASVYDGLVMGVRDYVRKCGFSSVVLGLSGGIDSALTAAIAVAALGPDNVLGVAMPSVYSAAESQADARLLAERLGCRFEVIPIKGLFDTFRQTLAPLFNDRPEDLTEQNLQARIRGNLLMALSNKFGHLLLTTGNKSEMAVGYCTLYGDMSGGLAVISDVPKQLVYELAGYVNREREIIPARTILRPPTAELKPDQRDQDDLPPYEILDQILEMHLEKGLCPDRHRRPGLRRGHGPGHPPPDPDQRVQAQTGADGAQGDEQGLRLRPEISQRPELPRVGGRRWKRAGGADAGSWCRP